MFYEGTLNLDTFKQFRAEQTDKQIKDALVPSGPTERVHTELLVQPPLPQQLIIIVPTAPSSDHAASFKSKINRSPSYDENENTELTDNTAAPPDTDTFVEEAPAVDESPPDSIEILAPPTVIIINDKLITENDLDAAGVRNTPVAPNLVLLAPKSANDVSSQNIEKLTSVKGRIGKRFFRCKYVNTSRLLEWLPENELPRKLVETFYVAEDTKRVLRASLLQRARELRPQIILEDNPHSTRSISVEK